jgi:hypothetical protein
MFQAGDKVRVVATGVVGEIILYSEEGPTGQPKMTKCTVRFGDGTTREFLDENELEKVYGDGPGFSPQGPLAR